MKKVLLMTICLMFLLVSGVQNLMAQDFFEIPSPNPNFKYGGTLRYISPQGPLAINFNTFSPTTLPVAGIIYEALFYVNPLNGAITPLLGTSYEWEDETTLVVTLRESVKWSDGEPFTAVDVVFTFNYLKQYPALDLNGVWSPVVSLSSIEAKGKDIVIFHFEEPNIPAFDNTIAGQLIIPEHIWSKIENPVEFRNEKPIGTGPFLFNGDFSSSENRVTYDKNPNFWIEGLPYVDKYQYTSVPSNQYGLLVMLNHEADFAWIGMTDPERTWIAPDPENNHGFFPIISYNYLFVNTTHPPLDDPIVRTAISLAIDKQAINEKAYFNVAGVAHPTGIIPTQLEEWFDPTLSDLAEYLNAYNPEEAEKLLKSAGYQKNKSGILVGPDGKPFPTLLIPVVSGWNDYVTATILISENLENIGIPTRVQQTTPGNASSSLLTGNYDLYFSWHAAYPTPFGTYNMYLNPAFSAPKGERVISNYSRYTNPLITCALKTYQSTVVKRLQKQAIDVIQQIFMEDIPYIPIVGAPAWNAYSTKYFVGWPTEENPYVAEFGVNSLATELIRLQIHLK